MDNDVGFHDLVTHQYTPVELEGLKQAIESISQNDIQAAVVVDFIKPEYDYTCKAIFEHYESMQQQYTEDKAKGRSPDKGYVEDMKRLIDVMFYLDKDKVALFVNDPAPLVRAVVAWRCTLGH